MDVISAICIGGFFLLFLLGIVFLAVHIVGLWNKFQPLIYDDGHVRIEIPHNQVQNIPATFMRDMYKKKPQKPIIKPDLVVEQAKTIELPVMDKGHVMIVGETGSGKTSTMRSIIKNRNDVVVVDPHSTPTSWGTAKTIGAGRDFESIAQYFREMENELSRRYDERAKGNKFFEPQTVFVDELPAIMANLNDDFGDVWRTWMREGRKVGLFIVIATQSTRVSTLKIKGEADLLENFNYIITIGKIAQAEHSNLVEGMSFPAVIQSLDGTHPVNIPFIPSPTVIKYSDPTNLSRSDKNRIVNLYGEHGTLRQVQLEIFGYDGGAAYRAVKEVLKERGLLE